MRRLNTNSVEFEVSEEDLLFLRSYGEKSHPLAAYARGLLYHLTDEIIFVELPSLPLEFYNLEQRRQINEKTLSISVSPNPMKGYFNLIVDNLENKTGVSYKIMDFAGQIVLQSNIDSERTNVETSNFFNGIYILRVFENSKLVHQEKIVKVN